MNSVDNENARVKRAIDAGVLDALGYARGQSTLARRAVSLEMLRLIAARHSLSHQDIARLVGKSKSTVRRYFAESTPVPEHVVRLLHHEVRAMDKNIDTSA